MKKIWLILFSCFLAKSCLVTKTAGAVVGTAVHATGAVVKGVAGGVSWAVSKTSNKIDEDKLDGNWKITGVFKGSYDDILKNGEADDLFSTQCSGGTEILTFKSKKSRVQPVRCSTEKASWEKYKLNFGKNPNTREKENYLEMADGRIISIVYVDKKKMILEGNLMPVYAFSGGNVYLLEKTK